MAQPERKARSSTERERLTHAAVGKLEAPTTGTRVVHDVSLQGLCIRITAGGGRTWVFYRRAGRQIVMMSLGRWPGLNATEARKIAAGLNAAVARGEDPREARRKARGTPTFGEVFQRYLDDHSKPRKRTWREDESIYKRFLRPWANRPVDKITRADAAALHTRIGRATNRRGRPNINQANRTLSLLSHLFTMARTWGHVETNPVQGVKLFHVESRDRFLQPDELKRFFAAVRKEPNEHVRDLVLLALYTGQRRANLLGMVWGQIDLGQAVWSIPGGLTKNKRPQVVPLVDEAIEILQRRRAMVEGERVFPITGPGRAWSRIRQRAGLPDLRFHDLRRSLGSWQAGAGASLQIIGRSLGHRSPQATAIYSRLHLDPVRASVETAVAAILKAANGDATPKAEAVELRPGLRRNRAQ